MTWASIHPPSPNVTLGDMADDQVHGGRLGRCQLGEHLWPGHVGRGVDAQGLEHGRGDLEDGDLGAARGGDRGRDGS